MSGRFVDFVVLLAALFMIFTAQFAGAAILDPLRDELQSDQHDDSYTGDYANAETWMDRQFTAVTKWAPTIAGGGLIMLVAFREYRRQRLVARQRL